MERLLVAAPSRYRIAIACGLFSGLRLSELLGLTWGDVDVGGRALKVRYQLSRQGKRVALKTVAARRDVILMTQLACELSAMRDGSRFSEDRDLVFSATSGQTIGHRNITGRGLAKAADQAGLGTSPSTHCATRSPASSSRRGAIRYSCRGSWVTRMLRSRCASMRIYSTPSAMPLRRGKALRGSTAPSSA